MHGCLQHRLHHELHGTGKYTFIAVNDTIHIVQIVPAVRHRASDRFRPTFVVRYLSEWSDVLARSFHCKLTLILNIIIARSNAVGYSAGTFSATLYFGLQRGHVTFYSAGDLLRVHV